jgi:hypothetical protein
VLVLHLQSSANSSSIGMVQARLGAEQWAGGQQPEGDELQHNRPLFSQTGSAMSKPMAGSPDKDAASDDDGEGLQRSAAGMAMAAFCKVQWALDGGRINASTSGLFDDAFRTGNAEEATEAHRSAATADGDGPSVSQLWEDASAGGAPAPKRAASSDTSIVSSFRRASSHRNSPLCYYQLRAACVVDGQLVLLENVSVPSEGHPPSLPASENGTWTTVFGGGVGSEKGFRLCNELRRKINFRYGTRPWRRSPDARRDGGVTPSALPASLSWRPFGHVLACWQFYGFHLLECLVSAYTVQRRFGMANVDLLLYNHAASLPRVSREHFSHAMYVGSNASFWDPVSPVARDLQYARHPLWGLYGQNTLRPADVFEVRRGAFPPHGQTRCYAKLLVGQPDPRGGTVTDADRRAHAWRLRALLGVARMPQLSIARFCAAGQARVTVVQRGGLRTDASGGSGGGGSAADNGQQLQGRRGFANVQEVVAAAARASHPRCGATNTSSKEWRSRQWRKECAGAVGDADAAAAGSRAVLTTAVRLVDWAEMDMRQQARVAASTNILVATHGAGNLWLALLPPRSVLVEVWPACIGRNVYVSLAKQHNMRYIAVCRGNNTQARAGTAVAAVNASGALLEPQSQGARQNRRRSNYMTDSVVADLDLLQHAIESALQYLAKSYRCCNRES